MVDDIQAQLQVCVFVRDPDAAVVKTPQVVDAVEVIRL